MERIVEDEGVRWRSSGKVSFKQVSFGLNQLIQDGIPLHMKLLHEALEDLKSKNVNEQAANVAVHQALALLNADLRQIEKLKSQVRDEELNKFIDSASKTCKDIHRVIQTAKTAIEVRKRALSSISEPSGENLEDDMRENSNLLQRQEHLIVDNMDMEMNADDMESIATDMKDLREMMATLNNKLVEDRETVEAIEEHVENVVVQVTLGEKLLRQARHLKTAALPAMGATVGFVAGGPIGAVAGLRVGVACSLLGGALGYVGGKIIHTTRKFKPPSLVDKSL